MRAWQIPSTSSSTRCAVKEDVSASASAAWLLQTAAGIAEDFGHIWASESDFVTWAGK